MIKNMDIEIIRRANLEKFIALNYKNKRKFTLAHNINYGNLFAMLKGERAFGERFARDLEHKLGLKPCSLDQQENSFKEQTESKIPIYANKLSAGSGNHVFNEDIIGYHLINSVDIHNEGLTEKNLCVFYVRGDSMLPEIPDGAKVLVDTTQSNLMDNKIYAISINHEIYVKRLFKELGSTQVIVHSENKNYPDKIFNFNDEFRIIGRVVYLLGKRL